MPANRASSESSFTRSPDHPRLVPSRSIVPPLGLRPATTARLPQRHIFPGRVGDLAGHNPFGPPARNTHGHGRYQGDRARPARSRRVRDHDEYEITTSTRSRRVRDHDKYEITTSTRSRRVRDHDEYEITTSTRS